ncbi:site-specific integrase, partial [Myxococcota bacterium]|nr:site-specific integrase [Myxococcota bacterium]
SLLDRLTPLLRRVPARFSHTHVVTSRQVTPPGHNVRRQAARFGWSGCDNGNYGKWRIRWIDATGNRRSAVFDSYKEAELALHRAEIEADDIRTGVKPAAPPERTFAELAEQWMTFRGVKKRSVVSDRSILNRHLLPAFGKLRLVEVNVVQVDAFKARATVGEKTIHNVLTLLVAMLNYAADISWLATVPRIRKPTIQLNQNEFRYLRTDAEICRFVRAAAEEGDNVHALYATAIYTGMRAGELAGLRWSSVNLQRRLIMVQASYDGPTKSGDLRHAPILDALLPVLQAWRLKCPGEYVFPSEAGTMLVKSARVFQEVLHRVLERGGFDPEVGRDGKRRHFITFHCLRHTFASHWMMNGGDIFKLQRIGGWKSFEMVQRYAHLAPDAFAADYGRMGGQVPVAPAVVGIEDAHRRGAGRQRGRG